MNKNLIVFPFFMTLAFIALASFPILANASAPTIHYSNSVYYPIIFSTLGKDFSTSYLFFSSFFMNETKYFAIGDVSNTTSNLTAIYRFDSFGTLENTNYYDLGTKLIYGNDINLWWWNSTALISIPVINANNGTVYLLNFNLTAYQNSEYPFILHNTGLIANSNSKQSITSISTHLTASAYESGIVEIGNFTIAILYNTSSGYYVAWDFYDPSNDNFDLANIKTLIWSNGLSDIKKAYALSSEGHCFYFNDCFLHIIFQGKSNQNNNREGIYVREIRKGSFGYDFKDRGLIGFDSASGFNFQTTGIDYWSMSGSYPYLVRKIYQHVIQGSNRFYLYDYFDLNWVISDEVGLNWGLSNNTAFQKYAQNFNSQYCSNCINTSIATGCNGFYGTINNLTLNSDYIYIISKGEFHPNSYPVTIYIRTNITITDSLNSSNKVSSETTQVLTFSDPSNKLSLMSIRANLPENADSYNITIQTASTTSTACANTPYPSYWLYHYHYLDVLNDIALGTYISNPLFFVTEDNQGGVDVFNIYQPGFNVYTNTSNFGIQTVETACICNEWSDSSFFNDTYYVQTRSCIPAGCNDEIRYIYNVTETEKGNTPDLTEGVNESYITPIEGLPLSDTPIGNVLSKFTSPMVIVTGLLIGIGGYVATKIGGEHKALIFLMIFLVGILIGSIFDIYPVWIPIILGIFGIFLITKFILGMHRGS